MNKNRRSLTPIAARLLAAGLLASSTAFAASGQFTFVTGDVRVVTHDNRTVAATRGMEVNAGDMIVTGQDGMAQLTMVDAARLSLRSGTQMRIDSYAQQAEGKENAVVSLLRGTMRTFTGLLSASSRDKFQMKTKVATVGIRGSGNILFHCDTDCPQSQGAATQAETTINHTIEGSHSVATIGLDISGLVTGPGQTVQVNPGQPPRVVPTPEFILEAGRVMTGKQAAAQQPTQQAEESRAFATADSSSVASGSQNQVSLVGNNGLGFTVTDATGNIVGGDPLGLRDVVMANGFSFATQATQDGLILEGANLRGVTTYAGLQSGLTITVSGGQATDLQNVVVGGTTATLGRWQNGELSLLGGGSGPLGSVHFGYASSGFPAYLSEVLTGTANYTLAGATSPTNQENTAGTLTSATLNVNFSSRTLNAALAVSMPATSNNAGGNWNLTATNVPYSFNSFSATSSDRLVVTNGGGTSSSTSSAVGGSIDGSFVGQGVAGVLLGYAVVDQTAALSRDHNTVSGAAILSGPQQNSATEFRVGVVSDVTSVLAANSFARNLIVLNRPGEITQSAAGAISAIASPVRLNGQFSPAQPVAQGTATASDVGTDATTGLSWGRWAGGSLQIGQGTTAQGAPLSGRSLHYVYAGTQSGPTALPLTGTAIYDVVGSTAPTDASGHVGTFNSASLNANFTARHVNLAVNFTINGQTWNAAANNVPIYRDFLFSAYSAPTIGGAPNPAALSISCTPSCGQNASGAVDGFFSGRTGQGAGMMYSVGGNNGAVGLGRRGG